MRPLCGPALICGWGRLCQLGFGQSHQVGGTAFQRTGNLEDERERGDMLAALDLAHVRPFDAGHVGQRFLSDALVGSFFPHGSPKRDGWFRFVGSGAGGAAPLDRTLWHCQERRTRSRFKPR
ncbi:plasmid stablization protein [Pseudomonas aeruginosa CI27]|nr:plasmid stablization protein [Pseudomonas aeruginosa CI27]